MPVFADALPMPSDLPINSIDPSSLYGVWSMGWMTTTQLIICWLIWLFSIVCMWIIFKKAWRKWRESIIPVRNVYALCKIIWKKKRFWIFISPIIIWLIRFVVSIVFWILMGINWWTTWDWILLVKNFINRVLGISSIIMLIVSMIFGIISYFRLAKKFGKSARFWLWLLFLLPIFLWILAFWNAQYQWEE